MVEPPLSAKSSKRRTRGNLLEIGPTGRRTRWDAVDLYRLSDGMIVEEWAADDIAAIMYQIGVFAPPWTPDAGR
jgi:predicted ester cyclase